MSNDEKLMQRALDLAAIALGKTSPNPMVGAVIVKDGQIVGEGYHHKAGTPHAEVHALRQAGEKAEGATIYVTLEPCSHYGRTPPCADAIIAAGISKVVAAMEDPNPKVSGQGFARLRAAGIEVSVGLLKNQAEKLNEVFLHNITKKLPYVVLKTASTLDGKVATSTGASKWITGELARQKVHALRSQYDGVLTGIGTVLADDPELTVRHITTDKQPIRVVLDTKLRIPIEAKILDTSKAETIIFTSDEKNNKINSLFSKGIKISTVQSDGQALDLKEVLNILGNNGLTSIMIEAGPGLVTNFLKQRLVDKWYHFIAPKLFGADGHGFYLGEGILVPNEAIGYSINNVQSLGSDIMLEMYPERGV